MEVQSSKKRRNGTTIVSPVPRLSSNDYFTFPTLHDLRESELANPGYLSRVMDITVGRVGYGYVKFLGETDVRYLELDRLVKFSRHEIAVYSDEDPNVYREPPVGEGLNKAAEVTLTIRVKCGPRCHEKLRKFTEKQGARFIDFNAVTREWKFAVPHFSRFGLNEDEEEDISMDDATDESDENAKGEEDEEENNEREIEEEEEETNDEDVDMKTDETMADEEPFLLHSLPSHLRLDPIKMKEMRMILFPSDEPLESSLDFSRKMSKNSSPYLSSHKARKTPLPLLEYNPLASHADSHEGVLMSQPSKTMPTKSAKREGFELELKSTPISNTHSRNIVDAGLFMGRSFRVGWGPNGTLIHSGNPVGGSSSHTSISSSLLIEKVAFDSIVRDKANKVSDELINLSFESPLSLHKSITREENELKQGDFKLNLRKPQISRVDLPEICRSYIDIIESHLEASSSNSVRLLLMHQVMTWELIKVLFSEKRGSDQSGDIEDEMKDTSPEFEPDALPLIRRAEFSLWLQESVYHRVQEDLTSSDESNHLEHILLMLTGRQLDSAIELAASRGDVRLACLLSQAGCSTMNRAYVARQLNIWRMNGLDFNFIEDERVGLYELLAGNIFDAAPYELDWKRFLGLLTWYRLPPDVHLPVVFKAYRNLVEERKAPFPLPIYIDEGHVEESDRLMNRHRDFSYYLMLLHSETEVDSWLLKTMFSASSSTPDVLDFHMVWHQRAVLEAIGVFSERDLHALDMGFVAQLLSVRKVHWAIYVALHMPYREEYPFLHWCLVREILFRYCETWSSDETQRGFIESLGVPAEWLHEALAVYYGYYGDLAEALEHFIKCKKWIRAHSIFVNTVAHSLFLSDKHEEVWRLATLMEEHQSEIDNWDLGAGVFISFYTLTGNSEITDSVASRKGECERFLEQLNDAVRFQSETGARVAFAKMGKVITEKMVSLVSECGNREVQLRSFKSVLESSLPEDVRSGYLQDAVALFTCYLTEISG